MTMNAVTKIEDGERADAGAAKIDIEAPVHPAAPAPKPLAPAPSPRRGGRILLMLALPLALAAGGGWYWITGGRIQETENANLRQARVTISSETAGRIVDLKIADNMVVKQGDVLFAVDPEPYRIPLAQADAALAQARLQVEQPMARPRRRSGPPRAKSGISPSSSTASGNSPARAWRPRRRWIRPPATCSRHRTPRRPPTMRSQARVLRSAAIRRSRPTATRP